MATSGTTSFSMTRNDIIIAAYELVGKKDLYEQTIEPHLVSRASRWLNMIVKEWQNNGIFIWKNAYATLFLAPNTSRYALGSNTVDCSKTAVETTLSVAAAAGENFYTLTSATGVTVGDRIGVMQDNGVIFWDGIASLVGAYVGTNAPGLDAAAAAGNAVYTYTTRIGRPYDVRTATFRYQPDGAEVPLMRMNRDQFTQTPREDITGVPVHYYFDRRRTGESYLHLWPTPEDSRYIIELDIKEIVEDFTSATDEPDFPQGWFMPLVYALAEQLARMRSLPQNEIDDIATEAKRLRKSAAMADREHSYIVEVP